MSSLEKKEFNNVVLPDDGLPKKQLQECLFKNLVISNSSNFLSKPPSQFIGMILRVGFLFSLMEIFIYIIGIYIFLLLMSLH
jgi:hypothetical protein